MGMLASWNDVRAGCVKTSLEAVVECESSRKHPALIWPIGPSGFAEVSLRMDDGRELVVHICKGRDPGWLSLRMWTE